MSFQPMTVETAVQTLREGGEWVDLVEAIGTVISDPSSTLSDIMLGLHHPGIVSEYAALALYKRTGEPLPGDRAEIRTTFNEWAHRLAARLDEKMRESVHG